MKFGLGQFTLQVPPWDARDHAALYTDTLELAARAEEAGFDSFWLAEHHGAADGYIPSVLPFLAAVAARTTRLGIGTAVLLAPLHDPLRVAEDAAVVQSISGGRLRLGLGLGWVADEYRMFGIPMKGRGKRMEEFVEVLRAAWTGERFTFGGRFYTVEDSAVTPRPPAPIPIWLGGSADAALDRAAGMGDGHFPPSTAGPEGMAARAEQVLERRRELGIDGPFGFGMFFPVGIGRDPDDAWASIRDGVLHTRGSYLLWGEGKRDVSGARDAAAPFEDQVRAGCIVGTPDQIVERLRPIVETVESLGFADAFVSAILAPPGVGRDRAAEAIGRFGAEVIPKLR